MVQLQSTLVKPPPLHRPRREDLRKIFTKERSTKDSRPIRHLCNPSTPTHGNGTLYRQWNLTSIRRNEVSTPWVGGRVEESRPPRRESGWGRLYGDSDGRATFIGRTYSLQDRFWLVEEYLNPGSSGCQYTPRVYRWDVSPGGSIEGVAPVPCSVEVD